MFKEYQKEFSLPDLEKEILSFWEEHRIFEKSLEQSRDQRRFVFYEGPPTANGRPGIHHVISRTIKDLVCRYYTMLGYHVPRKAGWDTHGLPVEIEVEKQLGINGKKQIEEFGVERFNRLCRESVFKYVKEWDQLTQRMGYWLDYQRPYVTFDRDYIETVWWILKQFWEKNLLYHGHKIVPYCPRCGTGLSSHEVSLGYREVEDPSVFVKVPLADEPDTFFLVWTTTPWTLISNVALAVGRDFDYVKVRVGDQRLILAQALLEQVFGAKIEYEVLEVFPGRELEGRRYGRLFDYARVPEGADAFYVTLGDFVSLEDGTGIVHIAPAFGADDYELSRRYGLPLLQPVDERAGSPRRSPPGRAASSRMSTRRSSATWTGASCCSGPPATCTTTRSAGAARPRCSITPASPGISTPAACATSCCRTTPRSDWYPPEVGKGRFAEWLENNVDWALSRDRYWGTPLPIWVCAGCDHRHVVGSVAELVELGENVPAESTCTSPMWTHEVTLRCDKCGGRMKRVRRR